MTEAYMMGFCKTAEEHGIDPRALMKFAQSQTTPKYQTNGYVPPIKGKDGYGEDEPILPELGPKLDGGMWPSYKRYPWPGRFQRKFVDEAINGAGWVEQNPENSEEFRRQYKTNPEFSNWVKAHLDATDASDKALISARNEIVDDNPYAKWFRRLFTGAVPQMFRRPRYTYSEQREIAKKKYDDTMYSLTNGTGQVSAPVKK